MDSYAWTESDLTQMSSIGISPSEIQRQLEIFQNPPVAIKLLKPAALNDGVVQLKEKQIDEALKTHESARRQGRFSKFVPASGAATRMFQLLFKFLDQSSLNKETLKANADAGDEDSLQLLHLMQHLPKLAFYSELESIMAANGLKLSDLLQKGSYEEVLRYLLIEEGLSYGRKPKGLVFFHRYPSESRTPFEEHLIESAGYCEGTQLPARVHFTVSEEHLAEFKKRLEVLKGKKGWSSLLTVEFSVQSSATQTIAVDEFNQPFRDEKGKLVFRPGGHGALIENLNQLHADVVYIKNIDNVASESSLETSVRWKKILGGYLINVQDKIFTLLNLLEMPLGDAELAKEIERLDLGPWLNPLMVGEKKALLKNLLNRPIRVCGVVRNTGEPGGGPFWVTGSDGIDSLQIVESAQVDMTNQDQIRIFKQSTHFNPVDLVCGVKDRKGRQFDLTRFVDLGAVFISRKSVNGKEIKALELPGLWNGAMADWITL
ncbi:MAG TPA: DUF4301 family protein, partial [bacterium]|nr:DUF4301 family protein [bacterium]